MGKIAHISQYQYWYLWRDTSAWRCCPHITHSSFRFHEASHARARRRVCRFFVMSAQPLQHDEVVAAQLTPKCICTSAANRGDKHQVPANVACSQLRGDLALLSFCSSGQKLLFFGHPCSVYYLANSSGSVSGCPSPFVAVQHSLLGAQVSAMWV
jgi:hypothetical protein